jgi:hypothetical protein
MQIHSNHPNIVLRRPTPLVEKLLMAHRTCVVASQVPFLETLLVEDVHALELMDAM